MASPSRHQRRSAFAAALAAAAVPVAEALEQRVLLSSAPSATLDNGTLRVIGTNQADTITLALSSRPTTDVIVSLPSDGKVLLSSTDPSAGAVGESHHWAPGWVR